ncbi:MAG: CAP domain-containing protein, partial [Planctomycetota bacterium]
EILLRERVEELARAARSSDPRRRGEAQDALERIGEPAAESLRDALRVRRDAVQAELRAHRAFARDRAVALLGAELAARRKEALDFILDAGRYPYPATGEEPQEEVERLISLVRAIWLDPYARLVHSSDKAAALDAELSALDERLARVDPDSRPARPAIVEEIALRVDMKRLALDKSDKDRIAYNAAVEAYNRDLAGTTADDEERANVGAVNEYRWMMGLHSFKLDERLVRAARKHSIEMRQLGYFDHPSPTPGLRTPGERAKREGYGGGVGENIARGPATGREAFEGWFRSSGHHRNMVQPRWTEMGCGAALRHWWTQLFGSLTGRSLDPPKVPPDPDPPGTSGNGRPAPPEDGVIPEDTSR